MRRRWLRTTNERGRPWRPGGSWPSASLSGNSAKPAGSKRGGSSLIRGAQSRQRGSEQILEQRVVQLGQPLGFSGEDATGKVGGEATGQNARRLPRDGLASLVIDSERMEYLREPVERALMLEPGGPGGGKRLDEEEMRQRRIGRERFEPGHEPGGK